MAKKKETSLKDIVGGVGRSPLQAFGRADVTLVKGARLASYYSGGSSSTTAGEATAEDIDSALNPTKKQLEIMMGKEEEGMSKCIELGGEWDTAKKKCTKKDASGKDVAVNINIRDYTGDDGGGGKPKEEKKEEKKKEEDKPVVGCMDATAKNYDPNADEGCEDNKCCEYDDDDGGGDLDEDACKDQEGYSWRADLDPPRCVKDAKVLYKDRKECEDQPGRYWDGENCVCSEEAKAACTGTWNEEDCSCDDGTETTKEETKEKTTEETKEVVVTNDNVEKIDDPPKSNITEKTTIGGNYEGFNVPDELLDKDFYTGEVNVSNEKGVDIGTVKSYKNFSKNTQGLKREVTVNDERLAKDIGNNVTLNDNFTVKKGKVGRSGKRIVKDCTKSKRKGQVCKQKVVSYNTGQQTVEKDVETLYGFYAEDSRNGTGGGLNKYQDFPHYYPMKDDLEKMDPDNPMFTVNGKAATVKEVFLNDQKFFKKYRTRIRKEGNRRIAESLSEQEKNELKVWFDEYNKFAPSKDSTREDSMRKIWLLGNEIFSESPTSYREQSPLPMVFNSPFARRDMSFKRVRDKWRPTQQSTEPLAYASPLHQEEFATETPEEQADIAGTEIPTTLWDKIDDYGGMPVVDSTVENFVSNITYNPDFDKPLKAIQSGDHNRVIQEFADDLASQLKVVGKNKDMKGKQNIMTIADQLLRDVNVFAEKFMSWVDLKGGDKTPGNIGGDMTSKGSDKTFDFNQSMIMMGDPDVNMGITPEGKIHFKRNDISGLVHIGDIDKGVFHKNYEGIKMFTQTQQRYHGNAIEGLPLNESQTEGVVSGILQTKDALLSWAHDENSGKSWVSEYSEMNQGEDLSWAMPESEQFDYDRLYDEVHGWMSHKLNEAYTSVIGAKAKKPEPDAAKQILSALQTPTQPQQPQQQEASPIAYKSRAQQLIEKYS